jgi:GNAT superfamily N-acetyltransferase
MGGADGSGPVSASEDAQPFVRSARLADATAFATVQHLSWDQAAREHGLPAPPELDDMVLRWERSITVPPTPRHRCWVAVERTASAELVRGVAASVPASDPDLAGEDEVEVVVLAVDPAARGQGHGSRLIAAVMDAATTDGAGAAVTWLASADDGTRRFLEGCGWAADGAFRTLAPVADPDSPAAVELRQVRLSTSLRDATTPGRR